MDGFSEVLKEPAPEIRLTSYGDFAINYQILFAIRDYGKRWRVKNEINMAIWEKFKQEGIKIPYPIMDVTVNQPVTLNKSGAVEPLPAEVNRQGAVNQQATINLPAEAD